ncbi:flavin reductase [Gleimia coleocanis DSM 15436]|uniref:Flavin reductase n=1 Tax=Gleimia coleocanis DSM 15436 TaxID=525245 RepID=C0VXX5_9ACTO|nr:NAD(P)H-dependent oxidoreductase [Gleimia coleocanis]EEH64278.1 flavin reductase [Gleimia coleocanis DSM 15436]
MKIGIVLGTIRKGRNGETLAKWLLEQGAQRETGFEYELIDLADFALPVLDSEGIPMALEKNYEDEVVRAWSAKVDACDAFVFVTPEYNHSVPGAFKNAFDHLAPEWAGKPIAFAGYSWSGGKLAVSAWRQVVDTLQMKQVEQALEFNLGTEWVEGAYQPAAGQVENVAAVLDALEALTK